MKRKKKIHTGVCITDEHIVCVTAHVENKTMVITDSTRNENAVHLLMRIFENLLKCMI